MFGIRLGARWMFDNSNLWKKSLALGLKYPWSQASAHARSILECFNKRQKFSYVFVRLSSVPSTVQ
jgi:hypothetical protein